MKKLSKEEVSNLALDYESLTQCTEKDFENLGSKLAVTKNVNGILEKRVINMERQYWSNSQYSTQECLGLTGIPDHTESKDLEQMVLKVFEKLEVMVDPSNIEDCH